MKEAALFVVKALKPWDGTKYRRSGQINNPAKNLPSRHTSMIEFLKSRGIDVSQYIYPDRGVNTVKTALLNQLNKHSERCRSTKSGFNFDDNVFDKIKPNIDILLGAGHTMQPFAIEDPYIREENGMLIITEHGWDKVFKDMNMSANPGYPWNLKYATKAQFYDDIKILKGSVLNRLRKITLLNKPITPNSVIAYCNAGYCDPIRTFIKNELHKQNKIESHRERLICNQSIVDEILYRLFFSEIVDQAKSRSLLVGYPMQISMGFDPDHAGPLYEFIQTVDNFTSSDVSNMDFSITETMAKYVKESILYFYSQDSNKKANIARSNLLDFMYNKVYYVNTGEYYVQTYTGITCSGSYLTTFSNTLARILAHIIVNEGTMNIIATGDNAIEKDLDENKLSRYKNLGFELKDLISIDPNRFEYCSHIFFKKNDIVATIPTNTAKNFANTLSKTRDQHALEIIGSFHLEYYHFEDQALIQYFMEYFIKDYKLGLKGNPKPAVGGDC